MQVDDSSDYSSYLSSLSSSAPASLQPFISQFQPLVSKRLYYQLLLAVQQFYSHPDSGKQGSKLRYEAYTKFVSHWKDRVSPLSIAELAIAAAKQIDDPAEALRFLSAQRDELEGKAPPHLLASMECTHYKLLLGDLETVKKDVDAGAKILNGYDAVETVVSGGYYRVAAEYYKSKALYQQYYTSSLLYLACLPHNGTEDDLTSEEKVERGHDLAIAAILGQGIWNFGELVSGILSMAGLFVQTLTTFILVVHSTAPPSPFTLAQQYSPRLPPTPALIILFWFTPPVRLSSPINRLSPTLSIFKAFPASKDLPNGSG